MNKDEFVEYIGKLWSMLVCGNKKYIPDKILEINGFRKIKKQLIDLLYRKEENKDNMDEIQIKKTRNNLL